MVTPCTRQGARGTASRVQHPLINQQGVPMRPWARWTARTALVAVVSAAAGGGLSGIAFAGTGGNGTGSGGSPARTPPLGGNGLLAPLGIPDAVCSDTSALLGIAVAGCRSGAVASYEKPYEKPRGARGTASTRTAAATGAAAAAAGDRKSVV